MITVSLFYFLCWGFPLSLFLMFKGVLCLYLFEKGAFFVDRQVYFKCIQKSFLGLSGLLFHLVENTCFFFKFARWILVTWLVL